MYRFNSDFDKAFFQPTAKAYRAVAPEPVDRGITNFFDNVADATSAVNNVLQFKMGRAGSDVGRVLVNSTVGLLGFIDVATNMGLSSYKEDFGQTLGYWGIGAGPYFMLPILGPSSIRDTVGLAGDIYMDPFISIRKDEIYWSAVILRAVDRRADLLDVTDILNDAAPDPYVFMRDAYLQRRENLVHDGNPPARDGQGDFWNDIDFGDDSGSGAQPATKTGN